MKKINIEEILEDLKTISINCQKIVDVFDIYINLKLNGYLGLQSKQAELKNVVRSFVCYMNKQNHNIKEIYNKRNGDFDKEFYQSSDECFNTFLKKAEIWKKSIQQ